MYRQIGWLLPFENTIHISGCESVLVDPFCAEPPGRRSECDERSACHHNQTAIAFAHKRRDAPLDFTQANGARPSAEAMPPNNREQADALRCGRIPKNCHPRDVRCALPHLKFFFKNAFRQKGYPLFGAETVFGQVFGRGGMIEIFKRKVPLPGGRICCTHIKRV